MLRLNVEYKPLLIFHVSYFCVRTRKISRRLFERRRLGEGAGSEGKKTLIITYTGGTIEVEESFPMDVRFFSIIRSKL